MPRDLSQGSNGEDVRNLQKLLNYHLSFPNVPLSPNGAFGPMTDGRVRRFQSVNRLHVDGIVGPRTRAVLLDARAVNFSAEVTPFGEAGSPVIAWRARVWSPPV